MTWRLDGSVAHLETQLLDSTIDLERPSNGLSNLVVLEQTLLPTAVQILQIHIGESERPLELDDAYIRGTDLIATYSEADDRQLRFQIYWRLVSGRQAAGLEVILSVQTRRLDVYAPVVTMSRLPWEPAERRERLYVFGSESPLWTYAEMVHSSNCSQSGSHRSDDSIGWEVGHQFFPASLEKGVLHRSMVRGMFTTPAQSYRFEQWFEEFLNSPPPLTV